VMSAVTALVGNSQRYFTPNGRRKLLTMALAQCSTD
jgi:hypothetical protein